jgi:hypothetical protein
MIYPINKGDLIETKDGRTFTVEALRLNQDGSIYKLEGVDRTAVSPMRTTVWGNDFKKVIKRAKTVIDHDLHRECELQEDGSTYKPVDRRIENNPQYKTILKIRLDRRKVSIMGGISK